ncbi:MAG: FHA domain-containing protein [Bdellovibrionota bacterium]
MTTEETELTFIRCPSCRSLIPAIATRCRMCGAQFEKGAAPQSQPPAQSQPTSQPAAQEESTGDPYEAQKRSRVRQRTISASPDEVEQIKRQSVEAAPAAPSSSGVQDSGFRLGGQPRRDEPSPDRPSRPSFASMPSYAEPAKEEPSYDEPANGFELPVESEPEEEPSFSSPNGAHFEAEEPAAEEPPVHEDEWSEDHESDSLDETGFDDSDEEDGEEAAQPQSRPEGKKRRRRRRRKRSHANLNADAATESSHDESAGFDAPPAQERHEERREQPREERREFTPREFTPKEPEPTREVAPPPVYSAPVQRPVETPKPEPVRADPPRPEPARSETRHEAPRVEAARPVSEEQVSRSKGDLIGWLVNFSADSRGGGTELRGGKFFVGRQQLREHDLILTDPSISTPHCIVTVSAEGVVVQDVMSERGTHLKKSGTDAYVPIGNPVSVEHGDWLKLGEYEVLVCLVPQRGKPKR